MVRRDKWMCITSVPDIVRSLREIFKASPPVQGTSQFDKIAHVQVRLARNHKYLLIGKIMIITFI